SDRCSSTRHKQFDPIRSLDPMPIALALCLKGAHSPPAPQGPPAAGALHAHGAGRGGTARPPAALRPPRPEAPEAARGAGGRGTQTCDAPALFSVAPLPAARGAGRGRAAGRGARARPGARGAGARGRAAPR
ncbi:unnamed protein product, partial [Prorocentrum cordatum]